VSTRKTAFGLDLLSDRPLPFLAGATAAATGREVRISMSESELPRWPQDATLISDERQPDGSVSFQIESSLERGYHFHGPAYGRSVLSADGQRILGNGGDVAGWQRLLVAQVLPFAAVLRGLEVLHASAIAIGSEAIALSGPSGSGKTSLALALQRRGAGLLADDVLAVERAQEGLLAHPGAPIAGIDHAEADRLRASSEREPGSLLTVNSRERVTQATLEPGPLPLAGLFFLERRSDGPAEPRFEPAPDPQALLATTFNLLLSTPQRLAGLLDTCAQLARGTIERIVFGPEVDAGELASALHRRLGASQ
jgi:hypothetical protein